MNVNDFDYRDKSEQSIIDKEELVKAYIGANYYSLVGGGFSWNTLIFSWVYLLYRKMYKIGFIWMIVNVVYFGLIAFFSNVINFYWLLVITNIILAFKFKDKYLLIVREKVDKLINNNMNKNYEELVQICSKSGGVDRKAILLCLMILILAFLIPIVVVFVIVGNKLVFTPIEEMIYVDSVSYSTKNYSYSDIFYKYESDTDLCMLTLTGTNEYRLKRKLTQKEIAKSYFIKVGSYDENNISKINANGLEFDVYFNEKENIYYYFTANSYQAHIIKFEIDMDATGKCTELNNKVVDSVHINGR